MMTKIIRLCAHNGTSSSGVLSFRNNLSEAIDIACQLIGCGKVIALPTDTIYGLAASAVNNDAIQSLYDIKGRKSDKPLAICVADIENIGQFCHLTVGDDLLNDLLPGPVTVVFERSYNLNRNLNTHTNLIGVRIPNYEFIRALSRRCGPLALTSANISSYNSTLTINEFSDLWPQLSAVFDGGPLGQCDPLRLGSTVVDLSVKGYFQIIRDGCSLQNTLSILEDKYQLKRNYAES